MSFQNTNFVLGPAGTRTPITAEFRRLFDNPFPSYLPGGRWIDGTKTRDTGNYPYETSLRAGLVMGKVTATGYYANSFMGVTLGTTTANGTALTTGTSLTVSVGAAIELVRRQGASGTFKLLGPATAAGTVRFATVTYSAVNTSTGVITVTAVQTNQVQRVDFGVAATGGNVRLVVPKPDGTMVLTNNAAWSATDATFLGNINTALDAATGVVGGIVASAIPATDTDLGFLLTFSGTGYAGLTHTLAQINTAPTSVTTAQVTTTTTAVGGFIAGSWVCPTDGSEVPVIPLTDGPARPVADASNPNGAALVEFPDVPIAGCIRTAYLVDYPTDAAMKTYLKEKLSTYQGAKFTFDDAF
jgi:hypothetical protein